VRFNNELRAPVRVGERPLIVYLAGFEGETPVEKLLGRIDGFRFRRLADAKELTAEVLAEASAVVLDNFPAERLGRATRDVAGYVRDTGGGLVMIGGPGSFGAGGYIDTEVDGVLPVRCDPRDADKTPLALVICLDASGSMGEGDGLKLRMARAAALRTISQLTAKDVAAVVVFRVTPEVIVPLGRIESVEAIGRRLSKVSAVGGTDVFPALERALGELAGNAAPLRHVVLLSDGQSLRRAGDVDAIVRRFREAKVSLSTLATGEKTDRVLLERLATETGGRFYAATDVRELPDLFLDDLRRIEGPLVRKGDLEIRVGESEPLLMGLDLAPLPRIGGYNRTRLREGATAHLVHLFEENPEPVLATGRAGLGRSAAMTLSFDPGWIGGFATWPPSSEVILRTVRDVARVERTKEIVLAVTRDGERFRLEAWDERPAIPSEEPAPLFVRISDLGGGNVEVPLRRTAARRYEGETELAAPREVAVATLLAREGGAPRTLDVRYVPGSYAREYRSFTPRLDVLEAVARLSGGRIVTTDDEPADAARPPAREQRDVTPWLVALAFALFMVEIVARAFGRL
jgi:uncharacterized membrane protein